MDLFNTISCAVAAAYEAVANRNRQAAVNNRLKAVVRSEMGTINRAYIALGKHFYNDLRSQATGDEAVLCNAIDQAKERILKAREKLCLLYTSGGAESIDRPEGRGETSVPLCGRQQCRRRDCS